MKTTDTTKTRYRVTVEIDRDAWAVHYGIEPEKVREDIDKLMPHVITEAVGAWIARTGNRGSVHVTREGR
jgi:hypothetical protein